MEFKRTILSILLLISLFSVKANTPPSYWESHNAWHNFTSTADTQKVDVFYIVSTNVATATNKDGSKQYTAELNSQDRTYISAELEYARQKLFGNQFNFFAPYYHQFTFESISLPDSAFNAVFTTVSNEVCDAFDHYMNHFNNGRKFIIAGFSQGAMMTLQLLRHMNDKQFSRMIAAYSIGYRLSPDDISHPHITPASNETDLQTTISFNTVMNNNAIWNAVGKDAATCINPINWQTDSTPASFVFGDDTLTIHIDTTTNMLIAQSQKPENYKQWMKRNPVFSQSGVSTENLHHWDILFYSEHIRRNAIQRSYGLRK